MRLPPLPFTAIPWNADLAATLADTAAAICGLTE
jgi:hypothetical protein